MPTVPFTIYSAFEPWALSLGIPDPLWINLAYYESNFITNHRGDGPQWHGWSYGIFQMHVSDNGLRATTNGQGNHALEVLTGHGWDWSPQERALLFDPAVQARFGMPPIGAAWNKHKDTFDNSYSWWIQFLAESGHPGGGPGDPWTNAYARAFIPMYNKNMFGQIARGQGKPTGGAPPTRGQTLLPVNYLAPNADFSWITKSPDIVMTYQDHWARDVQEHSSLPLTSLVPGTVAVMNDSGTVGGGIGCEVYIIPDAYPVGVGPIKANWKPEDGGFNTLTVRPWQSAGVVPGPKYGKLVWYSYHFLPGTAVVKAGDKVLAGQKLAMTSYYPHSGVFTHAHTGWFYNWATNTIHGTYPFGPDLLPYLQKIKGGNVPGFGGSDGRGISGSGSSSPGGTGSVGNVLGAIGGLEKYTTLLGQVHATLVANTGFYAMELAIDEIEQLPGWIDLTDTWNVGPNLSFPDPVGIARSVGATLTDNFLPVLIRGTISGIGLILLLLLLYKAVIDSGITSGGQALGTVMSGGIE